MSEAHQREAAIFDAAIELPPGQRAAYLEQACGGDDALRRRIEALLEADASRCEFLEPPDGPQLHQDLQTSASLTERPGDMIGRYKLRERIGEGGCGVVYVAEQMEPVRRRVALKIIKLGMDTRSVIARFEAERQALALMDHPNIAKVLDAGATETGRPYFVMELVRGMKITDYCDEKKLTTNDRLDLCIQVCHAIQHAHQKGIIHRDIKPSNILVTINDGLAVPKVIDFGVAKATGGQLLTDKTIYTAFEQFIGTPAYMSPEQAVLTSLDIDTRSDIYALGVLLYELLTGGPPFDPRTLLAAGLDEMRRTIREQEPDRPSTRVSVMPGEELQTTAQRRGLEAPKLVSEIRGDLDWIVMKCLEKDRARRYETADGLAADLKRHLSNEPVVARPPSKLYEFQRTVRRHKFGFAATAAIIIILFAGVLTSTWQATRANAALDELRQTAPAFVTQAHTLAAAERFAEAVEKLDYAIQLRPDVAEYRAYKGDLLMSQLKLAEAAEAYRETLGLEAGFPHAKESAQLCDELLNAAPADDGSLSRESLAKLLSAMEQQQRPAAELIPVARLLGEEKEHLRDLWLEKLKDLPIPPEKPLAKRLTVHGSGLLELDLRDTAVTDLEPLRGMPLRSLDLTHCSGVKSLEPLRGAPLRILWLSGFSPLDHDALTEVSSLTLLKVLGLGGTTTTDISPLRGISLEQLFIDSTPINDITPLQGMKLKTLNLQDTRVADLSPLAGMPLSEFYGTRIPAVDFSALSGAPLKTCYIEGTPIRDLSFLRGSPVSELSLHACHEARGYSALGDLESLRVLILPSRYRNLPPKELAAIAKLRELATLKNIENGERRTGAWSANATQTADEFWKTWDRDEVMIGYLRDNGFQYTLSVYTNGNYALRVHNQPLRDLSFLKDAPIEHLSLFGTQVEDLHPLENLPLVFLDVSGTRVSDLSPLRSPGLSSSLRSFYLWKIPATDFSPISALVNLEVLGADDTALADLEVVRGRKLSIAQLSGTRVTDISVLAGMPLDFVALANTAVTDISPLLQCSGLKALTLPRDARDLKALRSLPDLAWISFEPSGDKVTQAAEEFWLEYEDGGITAGTVSAFLGKSVQNPRNTLLAMKVAALQAWFGLDADHVATCKRELTWVETTMAPIELERVAKIASLRPVADASIREASLRLARKGWKLGASGPDAAWHSMTLGIAEYRNGHFQAAAEALRIAEQTPESQWTRALIGTAGFYRAMNLFSLDRSDEARAHLIATKARMDPCPSDTEPLPVSVDHDDLIMWLAYREASELIEGTAETGARAE